MSRALLIDQSDNVAIALANLPANTEVVILGQVDAISVIPVENIPFAHKIAIKDIKKGDPVIRYGFPIACASAEIHAGQWVHSHNARSFREPDGEARP